ncbi:LptF/LptG family permease [Roseiconus lacunae]|uniref:LptF/LptG family permease n=1 Tax=Roseiconus lacunae TaxID=2605694 RepID=A0ABT7PM56_9BACT|nr:LptF/LptG family permease [Roseiconus lacunae]MCD0461510.1 LptF/LptG family permease [Roseiconus lacunae]MDM4017587.1 LptF/LptG family permease [Roseiconus lacunae]WRQ51148.1 LptF/LptG family permease [Stieleria sp. HD01]
MPTRLTRYILAEIMKIFVVALIALTMLILLIGVGRTLLREGLGPLAIVQLLPFLLPVSLQFAFPATALFAVSCVYGRMAGDGEVSTVKASGISPLRILQPAIVFAFLLSPFAVYISDLAVSWGRPGMNRVVMLSIEDIVYRKMRSQHSYTDERFSIHVRNVDGKRLEYPTVTMHGAEETMKFEAREGQLSLDADGEQLILILVDGRCVRGDSFQVLAPGPTRIPIPLSDSPRDQDQSTTRPGDLPLWAISEERLNQDTRTHAATGELAAQTSFSILTSRYDEIAGAKGSEMRAKLDGSRRRLMRLKIAPWRRLAEGFSCFFFVLIGAPLAMISRTSDYWTTFGRCFLPTLLMYYPLFILGLNQAKDGAIPPYGVWLGNVALGAIGLILVNRVRRY